MHECKLRNPAAAFQNRLNRCIEHISLRKAMGASGASLLSTLDCQLFVDFWFGWLTFHFVVGSVEQPGGEIAFARIRQKCDNRLAFKFRTF